MPGWPLAVIHRRHWLLLLILYPQMIVCHLFLILLGMNNLSLVFNENGLPYLLHGLLAMVLLLIRQRHRQPFIQIR